MTDKITIEINVDTFSEADGYFLRTEIEARCINMRGPFPDLQTAQRLKADVLAHSTSISAALDEHLRRAVSATAAVGP